MKDLKHIHYFRELLDSANNELVRKATDEGKLALGYTCYFVPEVLLDLGNAFSVRLRAPNTGSMDISTYYMSSFCCGYAKALLERAFEGGYNFLSALLGSETCSVMNRAYENVELLDLVKNDKFFVTIMDAPLKTSDNAIQHYRTQIEEKMLKPLKEAYGIDYSDAELRKTVAAHNEICRIINEISEMRKEINPVITGTEFHIINLVTLTCPKEYILKPLKETLKELKTRERDEKNKYRARVVVVGSEMDDYAFTELMEESGALVVADRYCFGSLPGREEIILNDEEDVLLQICRHYLKTSECPRFMEQAKVEGRRDFVEQLAKDFKADGVVYEQLKFCEFWGYERSLASHIMTEERNIPTVSIDRQYTMSGAGQMRTRVQAFVESLEIKKINKERGGK